jgi:hypothetical protein
MTWLPRRFRAASARSLPILLPKRASHCRTCGLSRVAILEPLLSIRSAVTRLFLWDVDPGWIPHLRPPDSPHNPPAQAGLKTTLDYSVPVVYDTKTPNRKALLWNGNGIERVDWPASPS